MRMIQDVENIVDTWWKMLLSELEKVFTESEDETDDQQPGAV